MRAIDAFTDSLPSGPAPPYAVGTVAAFTLNGSNPATVTVDWNGATVPAKCPRHYTPVVGHVVLMARVGPQLLIVCAY